MAQEYLGELFNFQVAYKKYPKLGAGLFQFEPTAAGAKTLKSYGLHFKEQDQGFVIAAPGLPPSATDLWELQKQFAAPEKLAFAVFTRDPAFFDRAELPFDPPGEYLYYFNNINAQSRRSKLLLDNCGVKVGERVRLHPKQFYGEPVPDGLGGYLTPVVRDCRGELVAATQYDFSVDEIHHTYILDLARLDDGLYNIEYNRQNTTYYCARASFIRRIPLVILEVFVGADVPEQYQVIRRKNGIQYLDPKKFRLNFGNYYYYWRYKIIPVNTPASIGLKIQTDQSEYSFIPAQTPIDIYRNPVWFTSQRPIDTPNNDLTLQLYRVNSTGSVAELIGPLPKAEEMTTNYYTEGGQSYALMSLFLVYENGKYLIKEKCEPPIPSGNNLGVVYTQYDWGNGSGATVNIAIKNNGTTAINGWTLKFSFPGNQKITTLWRGVYTQNGPNVTVTNESYNGSIAAGGVETFGFNLSYSGANKMPTSFVINGIPVPDSSLTTTVNHFMVTYTQSDWYNGSGATVNVALKNTSPAVVNGWKLAFSLSGEQKITELWCGSYTQNGTNIVVTNEAYNSTIAIGGTVNFAFNISYKSTRTLPTSFTVL